MEDKKTAKTAKAKARKLNTGNIFSEGVLITLRTRLWGATGKLENSMFEVNDDTIDKKEIYASMSLLKDTSLIDAMRQTRTGCKNYIKAHSIYFPDANFDFIRKEDIEEVVETVERYKQRFMDYGEDLIAMLKDLEKQFAETHPKLYNPAKYPSEERLKRTLVFEYVLRVFSAPDKEMGLISPSVYKREMEKWKRDIDSMKEETAKAVCKEIADRIDALKEGCETGKISQNTVKSINSVLEKFDSLWSGFVEEKDVKKMIDDVKLYLEGTDAEMLRYDDNFRSMVANKAAKIAGELENKGYSVKTRSLDI
jgi:hypothetical protein